MDSEIPVAFRDVQYSTGISGPFTVKTAPEKTIHLPFALLPYGLFAGIIQ